MKFKSQICTTAEQSKRLLGLGLKPETADMSSDGWNDPVVSWGMEWSKEVIESGRLPAWSLHRLIEMMPGNVTSDDWLGVSFDEVSYYHGTGEGMIGWEYYKVGNIYDCIIECYERLIKEGYFNKKYLKEENS